MMGVDIDKYKGEGGVVDWEAYHKAQLDAGEVCRECGAYIVFSKGVRSACVPCNILRQEKGEVSHSKMVRCPHCAHIFSLDTSDSDNYDLLSDGGHDVMCPKCESEFRIQTVVSYDFTSPALDAGLPKV